MTPVYDALERANLGIVRARVERVGAQGTGRVPDSILVKFRGCCVHCTLLKDTECLTLRQTPIQIIQILTVGCNDVPAQFH